MKLTKEQIKEFKDWYLSEFLECIDKPEITDKVRIFNSYIDKYNFNHTIDNKLKGAYLYHCTNLKDNIEEYKQTRKLKKIITINKFKKTDLYKSLEKVIDIEEE